MKLCNQCKITKQNSEFHKDKNKKDGLCTRCKKCRCKKDEFLRINCEWCSSAFVVTGKKKHSKYCSNVCKENKKANYKSIYDKENRGKINEYVRAYRNKRKQTDPLFKLKRNVRQSIRGGLKRQGWYKNNKTTKILGCSFEYFKEYIENKFDVWMNWDNHGLYNGSEKFGWDLDHIIPISSAKSFEDIIRLSHYSNYQPLCSKKNRDIKKDAIPEYQNLLLG